MEIIQEIADATIKSAPEATGSVTDNPELTGGENAGGVSHKEGIITRKPGEKRGRKSNAERKAEREQEIAAMEAAAKAKAEENMQAQVEARARELTDYKVTGHQIADGFCYVNVIFFGSEFAFQQFKDQAGNIIKDEREEFYKVGADMAEQYQWRKLPPWIQIAFIMASYYGIRAAMPPVRARFGGYFRAAFGWVGKKWAGLWGKKPRPEIKDPPNIAAAPDKGA